MTINGYCPELLDVTEAMVNPLAFNLCNCRQRRPQGSHWHLQLPGMPLASCDRYGTGALDRDIRRTGTPSPEWSIGAYSGPLRLGLGDAGRGHVRPGWARRGSVRCWNAPGDAEWRSGRVRSGRAGRVPARGAGRVRPGAQPRSRAVKPPARSPRRRANLPVADT